MAAFKEIPLEIGFIEKIRTTWGNKEVPQIFLHNSLYLQKYDLIRLTLYHWQPFVSQYCDTTKGLLPVNTGSLGRQVPWSRSQVFWFGWLLTTTLVAVLGKSMGNVNFVKS